MHYRVSDSELAGYTLHSVCGRAGGGRQFYIVTTGMYVIVSCKFMYVFNLEMYRISASASASVDHPHCFSTFASASAVLINITSASASASAIL